MQNRQFRGVVGICLAELPDRVMVAQAVIDGVGPFQQVHHQKVIFRNAVVQLNRLRDEPERFGVIFDQEIGDSQKPVGRGVFRVEFQDRFRIGTDSRNRPFVEELPAVFIGANEEKVRFDLFHDDLNDLVTRLVRSVFVLFQNERNARFRVHFAVFSLRILNEDRLVIPGRIAERGARIGERARLFQVDNDDFDLVPSDQQLDERNIGQIGDLIGIDIKLAEPALGMDLLKGGNLFQVIKRGGPGPDTHQLGSFGKTRHLCADRQDKASPESYSQKEKTAPTQN